MSNKRKRRHYCSHRGCRREASVSAIMFDDDGTNRGTHWLCRMHAVEQTRTFQGRIWGDKQCQCGNVDHIIGDAGRVKHGEL
jgi:hypothetical protein